MYQDPSLAQPTPLQKNRIVVIFHIFEEALKFRKYSFMDLKHNKVLDFCQKGLVRLAKFGCIVYQTILNSKVVTRRDLENLRSFAFFEFKLLAVVKLI